MLTKTLEKIKDKSVYIEIFGLGYVGFPLAIRLAKSGLKVIGIDVNKNRIERLKKNQLLGSEINLKTEFLEIYTNSLVPFIYDCQNKIKRDLKSKTILNYLGDYNSK